MTAQPGLAPSTPFAPTRPASGGLEITALFTSSRPSSSASRSTGRSTGTRRRGARASETIGPRAAYQRALYGRTLVVQVHEGTEARVDEDLTGAALTLPAQLLDWPTRFATAVAVAAGPVEDDERPLEVSVLAATPRQAERAVRAIRAVPVIPAAPGSRPRVRVVDGDIAAWAAQGLPVR